MFDYPTIKRSVISDLFSLDIAAAVNMVNTHKFKSTFTTTNTFTAVMRNNLLSKILAKFLYFGITFNFVFGCIFSLVSFFSAAVSFFFVCIKPFSHSISFYLQGSGSGTINTIQSVTSFRLFNSNPAIVTIIRFINSFHTNYISINSSKPQYKNVAWNSFFQKLEYKAECADRKLIKVNPNGTSQTCLCGAKVNKTLAQRWHQCLECGLSIHRDIVSAKVVLQRALGQNSEHKRVPLNKGSVEEKTWAVTSCVSSESPFIAVSA